MSLYHKNVKENVRQAESLLRDMGIEDPSPEQLLKAIEIFQLQDIYDAIEGHHQ